VPDYLDHCADTPPGSLINAQGCTIEQLCPCDGPWKNHGAYVHCLKQVLDDFVQEGLLDRKQSHWLLKAGTQSDCGKRKATTGPKH
jgi:selenophosphate synthase